MSIERGGGGGRVKRVKSPFCVCKKCVPEICQETGIAENIGKLIATEYETHEATVNQFIIANRRSRTNFLRWLKGSAPKCLVFQSTTAIINLHDKLDQEGQPVEVHVTWELDLNSRFRKDLRCSWSSCYLWPHVRSRKYIVSTEIEQR